MRIYLYLSTAVAGVMMTTGGAWAQCVTTQDSHKIARPWVIRIAPAPEAG